MTRAWPLRRSWTPLRKGSGKQESPLTQGLWYLISCFLQREDILLHTSLLYCTCMSAMTSFFLYLPQLVKVTLQCKWPQNISLLFTPFLENKQNKNCYYLFCYTIYYIIIMRLLTNTLMCIKYCVQTSIMLSLRNFNKHKMKALYNEADNLSTM